MNMNIFRNEAARRRLILRCRCYGVITTRETVQCFR